MLIKSISEAAKDYVLAKGGVLTLSYEADICG